MDSRRSRMTSNATDDDHALSATDYLHRKHINELFEAMMTALMVHKPDDHIGFLRMCLDKAEHRRAQISWDSFVSELSFASDSTKSLPPIHPSSAHAPVFDRHISSKSSVLPPIEHGRAPPSRLPIIFVLSSSNSLRLCSKLLERYHQLAYLLISDMANGGRSESPGSAENDYRFDCVAHGIERRRSQARGFLIIGDLDEQNYLKQWQETLGSIDLVLVLSDGITRKASHSNFTFVQIDTNDSFDEIFAMASRSLDRLFPQDAFLSQRSQTMLDEPTHSSLPILFCIDNHRITAQTTRRERSSFDEEFQTFQNDKEEENNNSFIHTLCQCLGEQLAFRHIHYGDFNKTLLTFEQLKDEVIESMSTSSGFIIDHFPTSLDDLHRFQSEIGPCSVLIFIGDPQMVSEQDEMNVIIKKFKERKKALYVDCHKEVDEIYDDLKSEILKRI